MVTDKKETYSFWIKEADAWFSKYIRLSYADEDGKVTCSCGCGERKRWQDMQASHYINRDNMATRYKIENVVPATRECNYYDEDHQTKIEKFIIERFKYQGSVIDYLNSFGHSTMKYMRHELQQLAQEFKEKFETLKREKKL